MRKRRPSASKRLTKMFQVLLFSGTLMAQRPAKPHLVATSRLTSQPDGSYQATITIQNTGSGAATEVSLFHATLGRALGSPSPQRLADIAAGAQTTAVIDFAPNAGKPGSQVLETLLGSYRGGLYGNTLRVLLPPSDVTTPTVTATVDPTQPGTATPDHFLGFSMDSVITDTYVGSGSSANPILVNLINNFTPYNGIPNLRPAAAPATSTSSNISAKFLSALTSLEDATHAPLIVTIGLGSYNPTYAGNVAASVTGAIGNTNVQFELGNEPDQLKSQGSRPSTYSFSDYLQEYQGYAAAVAPYVPGKFAAGMASGSTTWDSANDVAFLSAESSTLGTMTSHEYPLSACEGTSSITISHLLSDNISNAYLRRFQPIVAAAAPYGVPVRAGEMNSVSCSGLSGVSNVFASSLWLLDSLFELQESGAAGMNLHTGSKSTSVADLPYNAFYVNGSQVEVRPIYYGMLMFAEAIQNNAAQVPVTTTVNATQNVKIWSTLDRAHNVARIVIIEKDLDNGSQTVAIDLGKDVFATGELIRLQTDSSAGLSATDQITLQGQTFDGTTDGKILGTPTVDPVLSQRGVYTVVIPDGSAAMLTVPLGPPHPRSFDPWDFQSHRPR